MFCNYYVCYVILVCCSFGGLSFYFPLCDTDWFIAGNKDQGAESLFVLTDYRCLLVKKRCWSRIGENMGSHRKEKEWIWASIGPKWRKLYHDKWIGGLQRKKIKRLFSTFASNLFFSWLIRRIRDVQVSRIPSLLFGQQRSSVMMIYLSLEVSVVILG